MTRYQIASILAFPMLLSPCAGSAQVQVSPPPTDDPLQKPSVITRPDWLKIPTGQQISAVVPARAIRQNVDGRAEIQCKVAASGKVTQCHVVSEAPEGYGFGEAVLKLSKYFVMRPSTVDGAPVDGASITIPVSFRLN